jgi:dTDP-4-amino-4,6-dideoxygalactose transaminase
MAGSQGDAAYFTFTVTKNYTTLGGGIAATNDGDLARRLRAETGAISSATVPMLMRELFKAYAMKTATSRPVFPLVHAAMRLAAALGVDITNSVFRETETLLGRTPDRGLINGAQAMLGLRQLSLLDRRNEMRRAGGLNMYERLAGGAAASVPVLQREAHNIFSACPVFVADKPAAKKALLAKGIDTASGFVQNCAALEIFREYKANCPNAAEAVSHILYLPLYAELTDWERKYIVDAITSTLACVGRREIQ